MDPQALAAMFSLFAVNLMLPGPNMVLVVQARVTGDLVHTDRVIAGIAIGQMVWATGTLFGLAALIGRSPTLISIIQLAGAAWFFIAGYRTLLARIDRGAACAAAAPEAERTSADASRGFSKGLTSSALNPGTAVLFASVMPALMAGGAPSPVQILAIVLAYAGMSVAWFAATARAAGHGERKVSDPRLRALFAPLPGLALMGFGFLFAATA